MCNYNEVEIYLVDGLWMVFIINIKGIPNVWEGTNIGATLN